MTKLVLATVALLVACTGGSASHQLRALPRATCEVLDDDLTLPRFGTIEMLTDITRVEEFAARFENLAGVYSVIAPTPALQGTILARSAQMQSTLDQLEKLGGTNAMLTLVDANRRMYAAWEKNEATPLFGDGGLFKDAEVDGLRLAADTLTNEIARDCVTGSSS